MENTKNINTPASGTTACGCKPPMAPNPETDMTGMYVLANALKANGVEVIFGLVGIPVTEVAYICQMVGIRFISFRFEQQAGMAAATYGYLTKNRAYCSLCPHLAFSTVLRLLPMPR